MFLVRLGPPIGHVNFGEQTVAVVTRKTISIRGFKHDLVHRSFFANRNDSTTDPSCRTDDR